MADRPLTRNATSRQTPQSNVPALSSSHPQKTSRVTRSQSRDVSDSGAEQMRKRRLGGKANKSNATHEEQSIVTGRQTKRNAGSSRSAKPLAAIMRRLAQTTTLVLLHETAVRALNLPEEDLVFPARQSEHPVPAKSCQGRLQEK
ncbi:MAG: hypothetical protein Q9169_006997 [Polycauliona sp. 2 TL-2023]